MRIFRRFPAALLLALLGLTVAAASAQEQAKTMFGRNADRWEARLGAAAFDLGPTTPYTLEGVALNGEVLAPSPDFLSRIGSPRPYLGVDAALSDEPIHVIYAGLNWELYLGKALYLGFSAGGSYNSRTAASRNGETKNLGSHLLFHLQASIGFDINPNTTVQAYVNHFSNAGISGSNDGLENTGVRVGIRF